MRSDAGGDGGAPVAVSYVPDTPFAYDGAFMNGSFDGVERAGWDTCFTQTPGWVTQEWTDAAQSSGYIRFRSSGCTGVCNSAGPSIAQLYVWFKTAASATEAMGLYFEAMHAGAAEPTGGLILLGTDSGCVQDRLLAEIPLADLQLSASWDTRCVTIDGPGRSEAIGVAVTGGSHDIGLDALRLGPPCRAAP